MQRIFCRFRKDATAGTLAHSDLRTILRQAAEVAGLPLAGGRAVQVGPALPPGATSDAERVLLELDVPRDPSTVAQALNAHLPAGVHVETAWIARPSVDDDLALLVEAVYEVVWAGAPAGDVLAAAIATLLSASEISLTRVREKKVQQFNARPLLHDVRVLASVEGLARLRMSVSVGPHGSLRPEEVVQALGFSPAPGALRVHRVALLPAGGHHPTAGHAASWRRTR
jgi:radical SAM-linked protein